MLLLHKIRAGSQSSSELKLHIATTMYNSAPGYVVPEFTLNRVLQQIYSIMQAPLLYDVKQPFLQASRPKFASSSFVRRCDNCGFHIAKREIILSKVATLFTQSLLT